MSRRRRLRTRPAWWLGLAQAVVMLPTVKLLLRARGYRRTRAILERTSRPGRPGGAGEAVPAPVAVLTSSVGTVAAWDPLRSRCLARSLTLWWLARRRGHEVELLMGVAPPSAGSLPAHAWVEYAGVPVNDTPDVRTRYAPLPFPHDLGAEANPDRPG